MLSKQSRKLLKWLAKHDKWMDKPAVVQKCKHYDEQSLKALITEKYLENNLNLDGDQWVRYRISDAGKAYLEGAKLAKQSNFREWLALILSVIAIIISIVT